GARPRLLTPALDEPRRWGVDAAAAPERLPAPRPDQLHGLPERFGELLVAPAPVEAPEGDDVRLARHLVAASRARLTSSLLVTPSAWAAASTRSRSARGTRTFMTAVGLAGSSGWNTSCSGRRTRPSLSRLVSCVMMGVLLSGSRPRLTIGARARPAAS